MEFILWDYTYPHLCLVSYTIFLKYKFYIPDLVCTQETNRDPDVAAHACNLNTLVAEAGGSP